MPATDPAAIVAWLHARSVARGLPLPVTDRGGWRVDTGSDTETARHVFTEVVPGLYATAAAITDPRVLIKLAGPPDTLLAALPPGWRIDSVSHVMAGPAAALAATLPAGYRLEVGGEPVVTARIVAPDGGIAASGRSARHDGVFVYDAIVTHPDHRRRGLGRAIMAALGTHRRPGEREHLTATDDGRALYATLGWKVVSPWSTAAIAGSD